MKNTSVKASSKSYVSVFKEYSKTTYKSGKYYFKVQGGTVYMAKGKNGTYIATPLTSYSVFANGSKAYYVKNNVLYQYTFKTNSNKQLKTFSSSGEAYWSVSGVAKGNVYLTKSSFNQWKLWTYTYKISSKKVKLAKANCMLLGTSGDYAYAQKEYRSDVSSYTVTIYKFTSSGLKKIKTLTSKGFTAKFIGSKLYYTTYAKKDMKKVTLYKSNKNGTNKKKIVTLSISDPYGQIIITEINSKYCKVSKPNGLYKYVYKTKKMTKIQQ